jgi:hypothetical protein
MAADINWEALVQKFCTKTEVGYIYSSEDARQAITELLGRETIESAVNEYIFRGHGIGAELARHFLNTLKSDYAVDYIYSIYKAESDLDHRISAIELFRYVVTARSLHYYPEIINDLNPEIRRWATYTIDQLIFQGYFSAEDLAAEIQALKRLNPDLHRQLTEDDG